MRVAQWVISPRPHTRLDEVRETLDEIEARLPDLRGAGAAAIDLPWIAWKRRGQTSGRNGAAWTQRGEPSRAGRGFS